jgi:hypothetical protein
VKRQPEAIRRFLRLLLATAFPVLGAVAAACDQRPPEMRTVADARALHEIESKADGWDARRVLAVQPELAGGGFNAVVLVDPDGNRWLAVLSSKGVALATMPRATSSESSR